MASNLRGYTPFELFNKVLNTDNDALQVDIVDATGVTVTVDSEFPAADVLADNAANPNTTSVQSFLMGYDSGNTNWNRVEVDDDGNLQVDVVSTPGDDSIVTLGSSTTYTENSSKGTIIGGVRNDVLAALADTDNEFAPLQVNSSGALYIDVANGGVLQSAVDGLEGLLTTIDADTGSIKTAIEIVDDWDESDRAAVNIIPSQVGVAAGAGSVNALTQRVILASDDPAVIDLAAIEVLLTGMDTDTDAIKTATELIDDAIYADDAGWTNNTSKHMLVGGLFGSNTITSGDVGPIALATDGAVHIDDGGNVISVDDGGSTISIDDGGATISIDDGAGSLTVDGAVTATLSATDNAVLDAMAASLALLDNSIASGSELQVDVVAALPSGTNTVGKVEAVGDVAENENAAGNPVLTGGRYDSSVRTLGNTDVGALALDPTGALYTREFLGQAGSILVTGTSNAVTTGVSGTKFVAIQFLEDTTFDTGATGLVASTTGLWPDDANASTTIDGDGGATTGSEVFPQGMTIFGRWDGFKLDSGKVIGYLGYV